jgi:acetyltransferase-like isoleucine patch superfamily enzyme
MDNYFNKLSSFFSELRLYFCNYWITNIPSHTIRLFYYKKIMNFQIGSGSTILMNCKFNCAGGLTIGENSVINGNCRLDSRGKLEIGNNVCISHDVFLLTADHNADLIGVLGRNKKIIIEDYVWIGARAMLLPGVKIGKGAVIAAGAIVTRNVDNLKIVAGVPAKIINSRPEKFNYSASYIRLFQ